MMAKKLHLNTSPLTGTIFAGHVLKCGNIWAANKQDVTIEALGAVIDHLRLKGTDVILEDADNTYTLTLTVKAKGE